MELLVCPACEGFVRREWTECRSCGAALKFSGPEEEVESAEALAESEPEPEPESMATEAASQPQVTAPLAVEPAPTPSKPKLSLPEEFLTEPVTPAIREQILEAPASMVQNDPPTVQAKVDSPDRDFEAQALEPRDAEVTPATPLLPSRSIMVGAGIGTFVALSILAFVTFSAPSTSAEQTAPPTTAAIASDGWTRFVDGDKRFSVDMPTPPAVVEGTVEGNRSTLTQSDTSAKDASVLIRVTESKAGWSKDDKVLTDALNRQAARSNSKVANQLIARNVDRRQLDATLKSGASQTIFRSWVSGNYLFELSVVSNDGESKPELFTQFAESIRIPA